ncbi:MAG: hypothetical protein II627_04805, partial [Lachnospiraceae bacterium]|nr:hypothetical protein [Lachnospiraceae bacterium]
MRVDLILNEVRYEYDIRGLILSFFPGCQTITISGDEIDEADSLIRMAASNAAANANIAWSFHYTDETVIDADGAMYQYLADQMYETSAEERDASSGGEASMAGRTFKAGKTGTDDVDAGAVSAGEAAPEEEKRLLLAVH